MRTTAMTWVVWRQYRTELLVGAALLIALAGFLIPTGVQQSTFFDSSGLSRCLKDRPRECADLVMAFVDSYSSFDLLLNAIAVFAPTIIGVLFAAPLSMEVEQRTYRLAWTQGMTRTRWLVFQLLGALFACVLFASAFVLLFTWWLDPQASVKDPFDRLFVLRGVAPLAYAAFCLAVALAAGMITRRVTLSAVVTLVGFFVALHLVGDGLRPNYTPPVERIVPGDITAEEVKSLLPDRAWVIEESTVDQSGRLISDFRVREMCPDAVADELGTCLDHNGVRHRVRFQPADRYWGFQAIEASIFLGASIPLLAVAAWGVQRSTH